MTTARRPGSPDSGSGPQTTTVGPVVRGAFLVMVGTGLALVAVGALVGGAPAAAGAGAGLAMVAGFFGFGAVVLAFVAGVSPRASLLVAMLTYTFEVVLVGLVFVLLQRSGVLGHGIDARWLGGTVIACTLAWTAGQVVGTLRSRQLVYDLPSRGPEASAR